MKKLALIGVAAAALLSIPASAQVEGPRAGRMAGPMTRAAVQQMVEARFARADADHDGFVTREEVGARMAAGRDERQDRRGDRQARGNDTQGPRGDMRGDRGPRADRGERRAGLFDRLDADHNGSISRAEFDSAATARAERREARGGEGRPGMRNARMMRRGMNRGMGAGMAGRFGPRMFERLDGDHDGRVSLAEASSKALALFDRVDADRNGTVTPEERRAAMEHFREARQGRRGG
jgi:Ca2+-binding EF-hand superfamily protein